MTDTTPLCCLTCQDLLSYDDGDDFYCCKAHGHTFDGDTVKRFYCAWHQKLERILLFDSGRHMPDLMLGDNINE